MERYLLFIVFLILIFCILYIGFKNNIESFENAINFRTYVINLDRSPDRLKKIKIQCDNAGIKFERWRAYDGSKLNLNDLKQKKILSPQNKMIVGAIGCSMSHINLWKHCNQLNDKYILVLEDDCLIDKKFKKKLKLYIKQLPNNWDIFYLGASNINGKKISENILIPNKNIDSRSTENTGMYAMMINKDILPRLIRENIPISGNIDQTIKNNLFEKLNVYFAYPPIITHNNNEKSMRRVVSNRASTTNWFKYIQNNVNIT
tara:strand:- start:863 stop:1645 length:783 start_codon:yes stop_codon:yes gene_type:complete